MSKALCQGLCLGAASVVFASAAFAQSEIQLRPRQLPGWNQQAREGRCEIRVWVDNRAEVRMRGDGIHVKTLEGSPSRDEGSQCSQPIPYNSVVNFQIHQTAGRDRVTMAQEPSRMNNYTATILIEDRQAGGDTYAFEVTWRSEGGEGNAPPPNAPAPFFDDVRACQDMVRQRFLTQNGTGSYIDFEQFADRQGVNENRGNGRGYGRGQVRGETIQGKGNARSRYESRELTYSCVVDEQRQQVVSGSYQLVGDSQLPYGRNRMK
jgi:hypothetical protein